MVSDIYIFLTEQGALAVNPLVMGIVTLLAALAVYTLLASSLGYLSLSGPWCLLCIPIVLLGWFGGWLIFGLLDFLSESLGLTNWSFYPIINIILCVSTACLGIWVAIWLIQKRNT